MSAAFDALASLYRRNDVETLRLVAAEAAALADLLSKRTASELSPVATSSRSEKARKAAQARWSNAPSNAQKDAQACSEQCSNDAPSMLQASTKHAPSMLQASSDACSEHAPSRALSVSSSSEDSGSSEVNTENTKENTNSAHVSERARDRAAAEEQVFAHWLSHWVRVVGGTRKPALDAKRRARIAARLKAGDSVETLCSAIDGCWSSEFHRAGGHTDILVALRDDAQVVKFVAMAEGKLNSTAARPSWQKPSTLQGHGDMSDWDQYAQNKPEAKSA